MHSLVPFLLLILASLSYDQLPKLLSVEARKLSSNGLTLPFAVELIHRDSSSSPYYHSYLTSAERLKRETLGSISLNHHFHLSSSYYDKKDSGFSTEMMPNGGGYLMNIAIGTPAVEFVAVADTGSDLVWLQCSPCKSCIPQKSPLFDPKKSSTYSTVPCNSPSCNFTEVETACIPNNNTESCIYNVAYGDGTRSTGLITKETVTLGGSAAAFPSTVIGCGFDQQSHSGFLGDGIVGLGSGSSSLVSQLGPSINHKFSYCLTPLTSGLNGKLKFGSNVMGPGVVSTPLTTQDQEGDPPTFYYLTLDGISIGNTSVPVGTNVIIDSGTTLTFLETSVYNSVSTAVKSGIGLKPVPDPNNVFDPCYDSPLTGGDFNPPDVLFHFKGADVVLKAINTFRVVRNLTCFAVVPTDDTFIFGNVAQVNFEVGYDLQAKQVSFAPTDCTKY